MYVRQSRCDYSLFCTQKLVRFFLRYDFVKNAQLISTNNKTNNITNEMSIPVTFKSLVMHISEVPLFCTVRTQQQQQQQRKTTCANLKTSLDLFFPGGKGLLFNFYQLKK